MTRPRPAAGGGRRLGVVPERLGRWLDGVADRHGPFVEVGEHGGSIGIRCADTTTVTLRAPFPWTPQDPLLTAFTAQCRRPHRAAVLLIRRGRWAVGVFDGAELLASKVDTRLVHGRTAAGGWSQQRFARRRDNQTEAVVGHAADTAARVLLPYAASVVALFTGGDRGLVDDVLADPRLRSLAALRRGPALEVREPSKAVLLAAPPLFRAVDVRIVEPADRPGAGPGNPAPPSAPEPAA